MSWLGGRRRLGRWLAAGITVLVVIIALLSYGYAETYRIEIKDYTVADADIPAPFDGTRIALVTDIHRGRFLSQERVKSLVERVNALEPDMIILGGDYVYKGVDYAQSCFAELKNLRAPLGVYAVLGNHDYGEWDDEAGGPAEVIQAIDDAGITLLRDDAVWIERDGARIRLGGVSDYDEGRPRLAPIIDGTDEADFVLLVSHNPDFSERLPAGAVDLVLSGHTHGGQVSFFGLWAPFVPSNYGQKYHTGMVTNDATTVIISNGIGTSSVPPIRLCTRPQIVMVTLEGGAGTATGATAASPTGIGDGAAGSGLASSAISAPDGAPTVARLDALP